MLFTKNGNTKAKLKHGSFQLQDSFWISFKLIQQMAAQVCGASWTDWLL